MRIHSLPAVEKNLFGFHLEIQATDKVDGERHYLEHMLLNSNRRYTKDQLRAEIGKLGGGLFAARTYTDRIALSGTYLKRDEEKVWDLLRSVLNDVLMLPDEVEKERGIILEEFEMGRTNIFRQLWTTLSTHLKRNLSTIGTRESIGSIGVSTLQGAYADFINSSRATLFIHNGTRPYDLWVGEKDRVGRTAITPLKLDAGSVELRNQEMPSSCAMVCFSEGISQSSLLLARYLSDENGPLFKRLREERQLCYMVGAMPEFVGDYDLCPRFTLFAMSNRSAQEAMVGLVDEFVVDDPAVYDAIRKSYEIELATANMDVFGHVGLIKRAEATGVPTDKLIESIPSWDEFRNFAMEMKDQRHCSFLVHGDKK